MGWFSSLFGGDRTDSNSLPTPSREELAELLVDYQEVQEDEGATGEPADYAQSLNYLEPTPEFPGRWPQQVLCGCCSAPFKVDPRKTGLWTAAGMKDPRPVPICAVCLMHVASESDGQSGLSNDYDRLGQQLANQFAGQSVQQIALVRIAIIRARAR